MTLSGPGNRVRIAIAGGGIIGLSIGWRLAQAGFQVSIFDQSTIGGEASWAGAGMLAPGGEVDAPSATSALAIESRRIYPRFVRELEEISQLAIDYQECGALDVAYTQDELSTLERRAERQAALGIPSKSIRPDHVATFWPRVRREGLVGAWFYPDDAIVNPRELTQALSDACRKHSVSLRDHFRIKAIDIGDDCATVESDFDKQRFDAVIVAAGAWSSQIDILGAPALPSAVPVKGHLIGYQQPEQTCNTIIRHGHTYLLQRENGLLIAGSSMEWIGFDREVNPLIEEDLAKRAGFVLPHLTETSPSESWIGFRPASDELHMRMWHSPRLHLAYGHFRNGILLAPVTAERMAAEITANSRML